MTYNVFSGTLNLTQSINQYSTETALQGGFLLAKIYVEDDRPYSAPFAVTKIRSICFVFLLCFSVMRAYLSLSLDPTGDFRPPTRGHFEGERVGTPFPLLKSCRNAWERRSHTHGNGVPIVKVFKNAQERNAAVKRQKPFAQSSTSLTFTSLFLPSLQTTPFAKITGSLKNPAYRSITVLLHFQT